MATISVDTSMVPSSDLNVVDDLYQGCCAPTHCLEHRLDPKALWRPMPFWDIRMRFSSIDAFNHNDEDESSSKEEGSDQQSHIMSKQQPEEVGRDCQPEPSKNLTLAQQSFLVRVTVHGVECCDVGIGW